MKAEALQQAALNVAQALAPDDVLHQIVTDLASEPGVALARIWLLGPGDRCSDCRMQDACPDRTQCLHLVASAGASQVDPEETWTHTEGRFCRFPLGVRKVGRIGASGTPELLHTFDETNWLAHPEWAELEGIVSFGGQPLVFRGDVLGVLAVFSRQPIEPEQFGWLRTFADHAATAIANARTFAELAELRDQLELERDYLRDEIKSVHAFGKIVGTSAAIGQVLEQVEVVAASDATVLIEGESGTGKELIAVAVHEASGRADKPLVRVNCASIPRELFESEFFGHVKGSFTGATKDRSGRFQVADGGTLFLDEVGEIPLELQGKLLRALQEGQFSRVGEDHERTVDVRVVAATNRDLQAEVRAGRFREDLYYRLTVFPLRLPPLRERPEDIPLLAQHFLDREAAGPRSKRPKLRPEDARLLQSYDWPGNVRELQNVMQRALIGTRGGQPRILLPRPAHDRSEAPKAERKLLTNEQVRALEKDNLIAVLNHHEWKIAGSGGAAAFLGLHPATLSSRLRAMDIERPRRS